MFRHTPNFPVGQRVDQYANLSSWLIGQPICQPIGPTKVRSKILGRGWGGAVKHYFSQLLNFHFITTVLLHHGDYLVPPTLWEIISTITMISLALTTFPTGTSVRFA